jgi:hypothetical protein
VWGSTVGLQRDLVLRARYFRAGGSKSMERWNPPRELTRREASIMKLVEKTRKLFKFLRLHRHELFDDEFQGELESMYRTTGAGSEPKPPAFMCMLLLVQGYLRTSDAETVPLLAADARWQMVLDCVGAEEPPVSQGTIQRFRERLINTGMDRRLLERTIELAKKTKEFDWKKLPKELRVAIDSRPLAGAGRVEDTINLLGHSMRKVLEAAATLLEVSKEQACHEAGTPLLLTPSVKAGLDVDWNDPAQKAEAVEILCAQMTSLCEWIDKKRLAAEEPLKRYFDALVQIQEQDLEIGRDGSAKIRQGVAEDRRVSIEDPEMRHGRKSKSKRFNGYKEHIATDLGSDLVIACAITPANRPEEEATAQLDDDMKQQGIRVGELFIDRGYINSALVERLTKEGRNIVCKPWKLRNVNPALYSKAEFKINMRDKTITCPAGQVEPFEPGQVVEFDPEICGACPLRAQCTHAASGRGRTVKIADDERLQQKLRKLQSTPSGRELLRRRAPVEHSLARIAARKGPRARYRGVRKNEFDLRRASAIQNLETIQRKESSNRRPA